ncbi:uncharacterized protein B0P05DRAFT_555359 [Gilbertella persicaria]|uniref:Cytochrome c oxidase assembly factor 3 n=1 Tax=Rhizopus stolonifer TaxID=4846 RepID=A0A367KTJ3_RHIST|nr:uncharacterized protein B0P05DRAFT_555359 [Gilbertella persicaria]KAI8063703.1 hypothetical protein B0P05DRAFT_555359 [Gilbertella persicaria]RCI05515.1 hypothetical protein CU098_013188 [Rhizopus stolonifer]
MQRKSLWGSYKAIPPKTRITLGLAGMVFATAGMYFADYIEQKKPATELEKQELEIMSPIVVVDRPSK